MKKKKILLTLAIASMLGLAACGETPAPTPEPEPPVVVVDPVVTGITLKAEGDKTSLEISQTLKFTATVTGEGDFNKQYTIEVDKTDIATISDGVLTAKKAGTVIVKAIATGDKTKTSSITITVTAAPVSEIKDAVKGKYIHVIGKVTAVGQGCYFVDDGTGALEVYYNGYNGSVPEGITIGKVVDLAGVADDYYGTKQLNAVDGKDEYFTWSESTETISETLLDKTEKTTAAAFDADAETFTALKPIKFRATATKQIEGYTSDFNFKVDDSSTHVLHPSYASDDIKGKLEEGTQYDVTGYVAPYHSTNKYNQLYVASVTAVPVPVTSITVSGAGGATSVGIDETLQMSATVAPEKATEKAVTWSVDNSEIATISETGLLTGKAVGSVVVTATAKDGSDVTGTATIKVLQFTDPVVSLTLGTAPSELVVGAVADVSVTVAGESSTSNFNPAYTATSNHPEIAKVEPSATGVKITGVSAGEATISVVTAGTDANDQQITKTIELTVIGEPRIVELSIAEAAALTEADDTKLYKVTGIAEDTYGGSFYMTDTSGKFIQGYKLYDKGEFAFNTETQKYGNFKTVAKDEDKGIEASANPANDALNGKKVSAIGNIKIYNGVVEIANGKYVIESEAPTDAEKAAVVKNPVSVVGGTYTLKKGSDVIAETNTDALFGDAFTITDITPAAGYVLGSVKINHSSYVSKLTSNTDSYSFTAWTYNEVVVTFINPSELEAKTTTEAFTACDALTDKTNTNTVDDNFTRVTGTVKSIAGQEFTLTDGVTDFKVYDGGNILTGVHVEDTLDVFGNLNKRYGNCQLTNIGLIDCQAASYTISVAEGIENGDVTLSTTPGVYDTEVSGVYDTVVTITVTPHEGFKLATLSYAGDPITVVEDQTEYTIHLSKSGVIDATFVSSASVYQKLAAYSFVDNAGGTSAITNDSTGQTALLGLFTSGASNESSLTNIVTGVSNIAATYPTYNASYKKFGLKFGGGSTTGGFTFTTSAPVSRVVAKVVGWTASDAISIGKEGTATQVIGSVYNSSASDSDKIKTLTFDFEATSSLVVFSNKRTFLLSLELYSLSE